MENVSELNGVEKAFFRQNPYLSPAEYLSAMPKQAETPLPSYTPPPDGKSELFPAIVAAILAQSNPDVYDK